jgi:hypothetical protein
MLVCRKVCWGLLQLVPCPACIDCWDTHMTVAGDKVTGCVPITQKLQLRG